MDPHPTNGAARQLHPLYLDLREKWKHEDELIHQRVTRLLTAQVLFLTAHGVLVAFRANQSQAALVDIPTITLLCAKLPLNPLVIAGFSLAFFGGFICWHAHKGINAACDAMITLKQAPKIEDPDYYFPNIDVDTKHTEAGKDSARYLPRIFLTGWVITMIYEIACWF